MKYKVISDEHDFYTQMKFALTTVGFFTDQGPHKLVVLGDLLDSGSEAVAVQDFITDQLEKDMVILIRGNHEDMLENLATSEKDFSARKNRRMRSLARFLRTRRARRQRLQIWSGGGLLPLFRGRSYCHRCMHGIQRGRELHCD